VETEPIEFEVGSLGYQLTRLGDGEFLELHTRSLAIADDHGFYLSLYWQAEERGRRLGFAQCYAALRTLCGESGRWFDDWKGSFAFPFRLRVSKGSRQFEYLLNIYNHRDSLYFGFYKILRPDESGYDTRSLYQPFADEFSRVEINQFIAYFYGYLLGYFRAIEQRYREPFLHEVRSNLILFGYCDGEFFERQCESEEEYERLLKVCQGKLAEKSRPG
jgi:hypothetical protein